MRQAALRRNRPSRLTVPFQIALYSGLGLSLLTGVALWWGQELQMQTMTTPAWLPPARIVHGLLNPLLCGAFGYLLCHHIPLGWRMKANRSSGVTLGLLFALLIVTGATIYYFRDPVSIWTHWVAGLLLPLGVAFHLVMAYRWRKRQKN